MRLSRLLSGLRTGTFRRGIRATRSGGPVVAIQALEARQFLSTTAALIPAADAVVRDGKFAAKNFGKAKQLTVRDGAAGQVHQSFLSFDLAPLSGEVERAVVRLYGKARNVIKFSDGLPVGVRPVTEAGWSEAEITFDAQPAVGDEIGQTFIGRNNGWYEWDVTSHVRAEQAAGRAVASFELQTVGQVKPTATFASKESKKNRPELAVQTADATGPKPTPMPSPEPPPVPTPVPTPAPAPGTRPAVTAESNPGLRLNISSGAVTLPDGRKVQVQAQDVSFAAPTLVDESFSGKTPQNWFASLNDGRFWSQALTPKPVVDTLLLGGLYRQIVPSSLVVKNEAGTRTYTPGVDYKLNADFGQFCNIDDRLGAPDSAQLNVTYTYATQRLDLIQVGPDGVVDVKQGVPAAVAPELPAPDAGFAALAGVHVNTLDGARTSGFAILQRDVFLIDPKTADPVNRSALSGTLAKLRAGRPVNVAFFGDSITAGSEAGQWWRDRSKTYTGLVTAELSRRFPNADISETAAYDGGLSAVDGGGVFNEKVLGASQPIDLLVIALGINDDGRNDAGQPDASEFKRAMNGYIDQAQARGMEVLLVTPLTYHPFHEMKKDWAPRATLVTAIRELAAEQNVGLADVNQNWEYQGTRGIAPYSQLHNNINHPGEAGHVVYAETILPFFE